MLLQSLWLTNRSLLDKMNEYEYKYKENEIIESLFGGSKNMIKLILKHKNNLSYIQQNKLLKILKKSIPKQNNIEEKSNINSNDEKQIPITLGNLNDDCLSYIHIFLQSKEKQLFAVTCRMIYVASQNRKCFLNSEILSFPFHKSYHFIQKISEIYTMNNNENNLLKLMQETQLLCSWIKNDICNNNPDIPGKSARVLHGILKTIAKSGLLSIFSKLLVDKNIIDHQIKFVSNILQLFKYFVNISRLCKFVVNANIIENLTFLMKHTMQKIDDAAIQTEIIPNIITIIGDLYFDANPFQSSIWKRVYKSGILEAVVMILSKPFAKNTKHLIWIQTAIYLTREWIFACRDYDDTIMKNIVPAFVNKIFNLIDVKYNRAWIYELLSEQDTVIITDPNERDGNDHEYEFTFSISKIIEISSKTNTNPTISLLGKYNSETDMFPDQQICVPLDHIHCTGNNGVCKPMRDTLESLCDLMLNLQYYKRMDFKENEYKEIANKIKQIIKISQTQFPFISHINCLLTLLKINWKFFMSFMNNEIEVEFRQSIDQNVFNLMSVAFYWGDELDSLCKLPWLKQAFISNSATKPEEWDEIMCINVLKNFCNDFQTFRKLSLILKRFDGSNDEELNYKSFVAVTNGIGCLFEIILTAVKNRNQDRLWTRKVITICKSILNRLFVWLPHSHLRKEMLKLSAEKTGDADDIIYLKIFYWQILEEMLVNNTSDHEQLKKVLQEMDWSIKVFHSETLTGIVSDDVREIFNELQTQHFTDNELVDYLNNIVAVVQ